MILETEKQKTIKAAIGLADSLPGSLLVVFTKSGATAHQTALLRPKSPIFAFTPETKTGQTMTLTRGVEGFEMPFRERPRDTIAAAIDSLRKTQEVEPGTPLVAVSDLLHQDHCIDSILLVHA